MRPRKLPTGGTGVRIRPTYTAEADVPIVRVEMVGDLTAILGSAKFEVVEAEEDAP